MRSPSRRERLAVLGAAYDAGIRHFDVARMYGLGAAERELGRFVKGRRDDVVLATKFGIEHSVSFRPLATGAQAPVRALLRRSPRLRSLVKRRAEGFYEGRTFTAQAARASLETSLRELGTDRVDLFLLHEPSPRDAVQTDEIAVALEDARIAGKLRAWGVSGEPDDSLAIAARFRVFVLLQLSDSLLAARRSPEAAGRPIVTFRVVGGALERIGQALGDPMTRTAWTARLGTDPSQAGVLPRLLLQEALDANAGGTVLIGTGDPRHVAEAAAAAHAPADMATIQALRDLARGLAREA